MKKIVLFVALFFVLVIFTGCDVIFNLNSNNDLSVDVGTKTDIDTNFLTVSESVVTEPIVTEPVVTEPIVTELVVTEPIVTELVVTEPADESIGEFFRELPLFKKVSLCCALLIFFLFCLSFACVLWLLFNDI